MSSEEQEFENWEEVIVNFFQTRISQSKLYKARVYIEKKENEIKKEKNEKKLNRLVSAKEKKQLDLVELRKKAPSTEIRDWLDINSVKNGCIMKATHALKFSHSSAAAEGVFLEEKSTDTILSTSSLKKATVPDLAHSNGNLISISRFLFLEIKGERIIDMVLNNNFVFLNGFNKNKEQVNIWGKGFLNLVEATRQIKTTDKTKQLYFPLGNSIKYTDVKDIPYHLITPLFSSSLAEELYQYINNLIYGEEQKNIKEYKKPKNDKPPKYHSSQFVSISNHGVVNYGGEYPRNVSMLNADRQGKSYVFSTQPPTWQSQLKPPIYKKSLFNNLSNYQINEDINYLREFLLRFKHLDLSIKDPKRYAHLVRWVESIIDGVIFYANSIQKIPASWSADKNIKLAKEHQYFLDPYRVDEEFQARYIATDWQTVICDDFAAWLNRKLVGKDKQFTPQAEHTRLWKKLFKPALREDIESIKAEKQYQQKEVTA